MANDSLDDWLRKVSGDPDVVPIDEPPRSIDILRALQVQNHTMIRQGEELIHLLGRIAKASEKTASHTFWIALPVWLSIITALLWIGLVIAGLVLRS
jgi:hypothetical protein